MSLQAAFTIILLIATLVVLSTRLLRADLTALLVMLLLIGSGILSPAETFNAFGQPVIIIIACIFVLGAALYETGVAIIIANQILRFSGRGEVTLMLVIMLTAGVMTAVLPSMLVVALLMPAVLRVARRAKIAPARLLLPLATAAAVGNQLTLIGTPPNLVASNILAVNGYQSLELFSLTPYSLASLAVVVLWNLLLGRRFLRREAPPEPHRPSLEEVESSYKLNKLLYRLRVRAISNLIARPLEISKLGPTFHLNVVAVQPQGGRLKPAAPEWVLEQNDLLIVVGDYGNVLQAAGIHGLEVKGAAHLNEFSIPDQKTLRLAEVIVPFRSELVGQNLLKIGFRDRYGLNVLAMHRQGRAFLKNLSELLLTAGDTLLVQGPLERIKKVGRDLSLVLMTDLGPRPGDLITGKAGLTLTILAAMLISVVSGLLSLATAGIAAVAALVLANCLSLKRAYQSINGRVIVLVGGMLPLSMALEKTGAAEIIAAQIVGLSHNLGPSGSLLLLYLLASIATQVIANSVVVLFVTPIAINLAIAQGLPPQPFAIAMIFASMTAYITPLTDANNLLVREAGQYAMRDFVINGLPIFLLQTVTIILMLTFYYGLI